MLDGLYIMTAFGIVGTILAVIVAIMAYDELRSAVPVVVGIASAVILVIVGIVAVFASWDHESQPVETYDTKEIMQLVDANVEVDGIEGGKYLIEENSDQMGSKRHRYVLAYPVAEGSIRPTLIGIDTDIAVVEYDGGNEPTVEFRKAKYTAQRMFGHVTEDDTKTEFVIHIPKDGLLYTEERLDLDMNKKYE